MTGPGFAACTYVLLVVLWAWVSWLYLQRRAEAKSDALVSTLLVVLIADAVKNVIESVYFGALWSARFGLLPKTWGAPLENPWALGFVKFLTVAVAVFVLVRVIGGFLPRSLAERRRTLDEEDQLKRDLQRSLALVQQSEGRLHSLLERTSDIVSFWIVVDEELVLESVNEAGRAMLGFSDADIGSAWREVAPPPLQTLLLKAWETGRPQREEDGWIETPSGRRAVIRQVVPMPDEDGVIRRLASFTQDITALRERQAEEEGRARLESLGILAGGVAHDFNNLLTILRADLDCAAATETTADERASALEHADVTIHRTSALVTQLLAMAGQRAPVTAPVDLGAVVEDTARLLLPSVPAGVQLTTTIAPDGVVIGDRTQLQQIVLNVLKNAIDAVADRPKAHVRASLSLENDTVVLVVADDGPGIAPEVQWRIFEPFFSTKRGGRGLGLATVFGLTRAHGGSVEVSSSLGQGATFTVRLPRTVGAIPSVSLPSTTSSSSIASAVASSAASTSRSTSLSPRRRAQEGLTVLLVDDDPRVRRATSRLLERLGHRVVMAGSGHEALSITELVDVAVVDVTMPEMDGPTTLKKLREARGELPGVLVTGRGAVSDADVVLSKPFDEQDLSRVLERVLLGASLLESASTASSTDPAASVESSSSSQH
jgi:PAS domain S-box-containing protein